MITKKKTGLIIIILLSIIFLIFFFHLKKTYAYNDDENNNVNKYIESVASLVDEQTIGKYKNVVSIEDDRYISKLFNIKSGEEVSIESILKKEYVSLFWAKVKELLYLKYPKFIAEVLDKHNKTNAYFINDNELIIYFYDYEITPEVSEELSLHVNYNEIKDYLDITYKLDKEYQNEDGRVVQKNKKHIAITFDDGPSIYTNDLINILKDNKASSTFFILGKNIEYYKDTIRYMNESKMEIGYHSYNHKNFKRQKLEVIKDEFDKSNKALYSITGEVFHLIRPPYGEINKNIKNNLDASFILWDVDTLDWRYKDVDYLVNYTLENITDKDIILFHDIHKTSISAIEKLLPLLYVNGYQVLTVSDLAKTSKVTLENHKSYRNFK